MNAATIERLNQINREFYETVASSFDETRAAPWPGWVRLLPFLEVPLSVLDVGCGNGRFGVFLMEWLPGSVAYHGMDSSSTLLARAAAALSGAGAHLELRDIVHQPPDSGEYTLVSAFGVLHHIPDAGRRLDFVRVLAERVAPGGLLAFTTWRFWEFERFRSRITPWPEGWEVERHDYLLDWRRGVTAVRYCHYVDDAEQAALLRATGLEEITSFRADGQTGDMNVYAVLRRQTV